MKEKTHYPTRILVQRWAGRTLMEEEFWLDTCTKTLTPAPATEIAPGVCYMLGGPSFELRGELCAPPKRRRKAQRFA